MGSAVSVNGTRNTRLNIIVPGGAIATDEAARIIERHLPDWLDLFLVKNRKYKGLANNALGSRGKFVDLFRKTMVLKSRIWDGHEVVGEDNREVILDMIGHLFLMLSDMETEASSHLRENMHPDAGGPH